MVNGLLRTRLSESGIPCPSEPWALIFDGVTSEGARRACRAASEAIEMGLHVVLFDGVGFDFEGELGREAGPAMQFLIIDYSHEQNDTLSSRLSSLRRTSSGFGPAIGRVVGRLGTLGRGLSGWRLLRRCVRELRRGKAPDHIVYCDEWAFVAAWHSARIWPDVPVGPVLAPS